MATRKPVQPGQPVAASQSGQPIMVLLDLLGRRWALRIIWELRGGQRYSFRELQAACAIGSPTALNTRLAELREAGVVEHADGQGYGLTPRGADLLERMRPLGEWADDWARAVGRDDLTYAAKRRAARSR